MDGSGHAFNRAVHIVQSTRTRSTLRVQGDPLSHESETQESRVVLVIDDDALSRRLLVRILSREGFEVREVDEELVVGQPPRNIYHF